MKKGLKTLLLYLLLIGTVILIVVYVSGSFKQKELTTFEVYTYFKEERVKEFVVSNDNVLTLTLYKKNADGTINYGEAEKQTVSFKLRSLSFFHEDIYEKFVVNQVDRGIITSYHYEPEATIPFWVSFLPYIVLIVLFIVFWIFFVGRANNPGGKIASFGKARVKVPSSDKNRVTFADVAGADEEKAELEEVVEFLKNPPKFTKLGAKIPHGVLLVGPPGTGKTLLAKAVAGEAGVPFFSISGSDFVEMYVGVGASRVRDLFETARKAPASIVFIDEIDAVGRHRGAGLGGGHDEREQTLNQLLVEMDGFGSHDGIIVIAATNRPDILDPALLRPGRFDRQITVNYPDLQGRADILKVHARNKPLEDSVNLFDIAKTTVGFTGADLANLLNEAALLAARRGKSLIGRQDIEDAYLKIVAGPKKKTRKIKESELRNTAYHEAGHAIVAHVLPYNDPVQLISIVPSGNALGYTLNPPVEDKFSIYREEIKQKIAMMLGGRAAEELINKDFSGGASNDIQRATRLARRMVTELGMSDLLGPVHYGSESSEVFLGRDFSASPDHSEKISALIDDEVHKIITEAHETAKRILSENIDKLHFVAEYLFTHETMDGDQFKAAMDDGADTATLEAIAEKKSRQSREANAKRASDAAKEQASDNTDESASDEASNDRHESSHL